MRLLNWTPEPPLAPLHLHIPAHAKSSGRGQGAYRSRSAPQFSQRVQNARVREDVKRKDTEALEGTFFDVEENPAPVVFVKSGVVESVTRVSEPNVQSMQMSTSEWTVQTLKTSAPTQIGMGHTEEDDALFDYVFGDIFEANSEEDAFVSDGRPRETLQLDPGASGSAG